MLSEVDLPLIVSSSILSKPILVLELPRRPYNSLRRRGLNTIRDVLLLGEDGVAELPQVGKQQVDIIFNAIAKLLGISREQIKNLTLDNNPAESSEEIFDAPRVLLQDTMPEEKFEFPIEILHLPITILLQNTRYVNVLHKSNIFTVGDYLNIKDNKSGAIAGFGIKSIQEIEVNLDRLASRFTSSLDKFDLDRIQEFLNGDKPFIVEIPEGQAFPNLIKLIEPFAKAALSQDAEDRSLKILIARFGLGGSEIYTLQDVGNAYGITRERTRQIQDKALQRLHSILFGAKSLASYVIPLRLVNEALAVKQELSHLDKKLLSEYEIINFFCLRYEVKLASKDLNSLRFLLTILGYTPLATRFPSVELAPSWQIGEQLDSDNIVEAAKAILGVLKNEVCSVPLFELQIKINRKRKSKFSLDCVHYALKLLNHDIELAAKDEYQLKFAKLSSKADQVYRVLKTANKPMHYRDFAKEINHLLVTSGEKPNANLRSIISQLATDKRFKNIGNSGIWGLDEWEDIVGSSVIELMEEFFHLKKRPATSSEIYEYVAAKRSIASKNSIYTYLAMKEQFIRVSETEYALKEWGNKPYARISRNLISETIAAITSEIFKSKSIQSIPVRQLVNQIAEKASISERVIYRELDKLEFLQIEIDPEKSNRKLARLLVQKKNLQSDTLSSHEPKKISQQRVTLMQKVFTAIENYLQRQPELKATISQVADYVMAKTDCSKPTFYNYLARMPHIQKETVNRVAYCYILKQETSSLAFVQVDKIHDAELKGNVNRAIKLLNIDNVDIGLFQLGKLFEAQLKIYLTKVRSKNIFPVSADDLSKLVGMIDCVAKNGVIKSKHELTYLREERNLRAHGEIPTRAEREDLMRRARFLAELYIDYIVLFEEKYRMIG